MIKKTFIPHLFLCFTFFNMIHAEETYLEPGKLIFSQGGFLQSYAGTTDATTNKSNLDGYLKVGNSKGIEFPGTILEIATSQTSPYSLSKSFTTDLHNLTNVNPTYLFSGSKLNKFVLMEKKDNKFGFSAYVGSTASGFTPSMLYIQKKKEIGTYNTVLNNLVYVFTFPTEARVGIGVSTPQAALDVSGDLKLAGALSLPSDTMISSAEGQGNTGWGSTLYLCPTTITISDVPYNVIFFVTCKIKTIGGRPNFRIYISNGTTSPTVYPGWVGYNGNTSVGSTYFRDAATIGLSWSTNLPVGTYTAYVVVNGIYSPNFEVKLSYVKMMAGISGVQAPVVTTALPQDENASSFDLLNANLSSTFFTSNTLVLTPPGYSSTDEWDATSILQNSKAGLILRSKKGLRDLIVERVKVYDKAQKYDLLVYKSHPQSGSAAYNTPIVTGSSTGPVGFTAYPAYIKEAYDSFNAGSSVLELPQIETDRINEVSANIGYTSDFYFKNKVNISNAIIVNTNGVHISNEPIEPINTSPILNINGDIIVRGKLIAKMGFITQNTLTAAVSFPFTNTVAQYTKRITDLNLTIKSLGANARAKVMVSAILPFKLHGSTYANSNTGYRVTLYVNNTVIGSGYIGQSAHISNQGYSRLYTLQINGVIDNVPASGTTSVYPVDVEISNNIGGVYRVGDVPLYLLADQFNKASIIYIGTAL